MDVAGDLGGLGEVAGHEVEAAVAAFVEDDFSVVVEDEDVFGVEVIGEPVAEDVDALEEAGLGIGIWWRGWVGWRRIFYVRWFCGSGSWWGNGCGVDGDGGDGRGRSFGEADK